MVFVTIKHSNEKNKNNEKSDAAYLKPMRGLRHIMPQVVMPQVAMPQVVMPRVIMPDMKKNLKTILG